MYTTLNWPETSTLPLPEDVPPLLQEHLTEGFDSTDEAQRYWQQISTVLIILSPDDSPETINNAPSELQDQLAFALAYPEYVVPIGDEYQIALAICSDEGAGIYLLVHNDCIVSKELGNA